MKGTVICCGGLYLHRWDCFGSLEDWPSFASFFPSFLESGLARLFCFFEGAFAILSTLSDVTEAGVDGCKVQLWLRTSIFNAALQSCYKTRPGGTCARQRGALRAVNILLLLL